MKPILVFSVVGIYFLFLLALSFLIAKKSDNKTFYTGDRNSPWYLVAFGMIGTSLSGVTFISVPGAVGAGKFFYFQIVLGYLVGYLVIIKILLPLYYRLKLVSIYSYLDQRFGFWSYKTGAAFFLLSRVIGASFRLFLVTIVLQFFFFGPMDLPYWVSVSTTIVLIWIYTFRGGIKTIVWTDTLQTTFMISAVLIAIYLIGTKLDKSFLELSEVVINSKYSQLFNWNLEDKSFFFKNFIFGAMVTIVMTGLDQDLMQKNLTCRSLSDAQKNMFWLSIILLFVNLVFLSLGALLFEYSASAGIVIPERTDLLFPSVAINHLGALGGTIFLLGITAAAYSSADSALTALTTSFCVDILSHKEVNKNERIVIHLAFSLLVFVVILIFEAINDDNVINAVFRVAGYTYGPLLGLFSFGLFTPWKVKDNLVPIVCVLSPLLSYLINEYSKILLFGYQFGFEILLVNGLITFLGLFFIKKR